MKAGSFLGLSSLKTYRRDNYMTKIFNKGGLASAENRDKADLVRKVEQTIKSRIAAYQMPERSAAQRKLLQPFLPSQCR